MCVGVEAFAGIILCPYLARNWKMQRQCWTIAGVIPGESLSRALGY